MKNIIIPTLLVLTLILSGCSGMNYSGTCTTDLNGHTTCTGTIGGKVKSISDNLYSYAAQQLFDPSVFNIELNGSEITNNEVTIIILDLQKNKLASKLFQVNKKSGRYYLTNPELVKNWSYNFINMATGASVEIATNKIDTSSASNLIFREENTIIAASSWSTKPSDGFPPVHRKNI